MFSRKDALLSATRALPAAASTTVDGAIIDLGHSARGELLAPRDFLLTAPAVTTTMAPDTRTLTYSILESDNADLSGPTVAIANAIVQTGAGGAGAASATKRFALPSTTKRYIGVRIVSGASITDSSAVAATLEVLL